MSTQLKFFFYFSGLFFIINNLHGEVPHTNWPEPIYTWYIYEYIQNQSIQDEQQLEQEYKQILSFLKKVVMVYKENIINYYDRPKADFYYPTLQNGNFVILVQPRTISKWDAEKKEFYPSSNPNIIDLYGHFYSTMSTFNQFVTFWFDKSGVYLEDLYDIDSECEYMMKNYLDKDPYIRSETN